MVREFSETLLQIFPALQELRGGMKDDLIETLQERAVGAGTVTREGLHEGCVKRDWVN